MEIVTDYSEDVIETSIIYVKEVYKCHTNAYLQKTGKARGASPVDLHFILHLLADKICQNMPRFADFE